MAFIKKTVCKQKARKSVCVCVCVFVRVRVCVRQFQSLFGKNHPFSWCSMEAVHSNTSHEKKFHYVHNSGKIICVYRTYVERELVRVALL